MKKPSRKNQRFLFYLYLYLKENQIQQSMEPKEEKVKTSERTWIQRCENEIRNPERNGYTEWEFSFISTSKRYWALRFKSAAITDTSLSFQKTTLRAERHGEINPKREGNSHKTKRNQDQIERKLETHIP